MYKCAGGEQKWEIDVWNLQPRIHLSKTDILASLL